MLNSDPEGQNVYAVPDQHAGVVEVGVQDPNAPLPSGSSLAQALVPHSTDIPQASPTLAQALGAKYGDGIKVIKTSLCNTARPS